MQAGRWSRGAAIAIGLSLGWATSAVSLTPSQQQQLKSLGIPVIVPGKVPAGFQVKKISVDPCPPNAPREGQGVCRFGPDYEILYHNSKGNCFTMVAVGGGVGGVDQAYGYEVDVPLFRDRVMLWFGDLNTNSRYRVPTAQQRQQPQASLRSDWVGKGPFYGVSYVQKDPQCRRGITPSQAEQILRSLQFLR
ncbi:hypothetical protein [Synechococcus elongatus]|uniref:Uncharacterized protein n=1 Tax=Synechococcus elongatus PCC 11802 TaxID=2283154 RepID=A0AAT9JVT4_SYNEL|nr:hypothetical protein [Synechococcus elongatus]QFZ92256.1 hypothetical protein EKO22_07690 [Synechococcus elongatus PCC 11802]